jgi:nucleotide-binding universal stress UspA family protein
MGTIVVGIDGSEASRDALRWAHEEARLRGASLRLVHVWVYPYLGPRTGVHEPRELMEGDAAALLADELQRFRAEVPDGVTVETRLLEGSPADGLVAESRDADLVVVGTRGRGGFSTLLLGSVSSAVAHHAHCPVVLVR